MSSLQPLDEFLQLYFVLRITNLAQDWFNDGLLWTR